MEIYTGEVLWRMRRIAVLLERIEERSSVRLSKNCKAWIEQVKADEMESERMAQLIQHVIDCTNSFKPQNEYEKADIALILDDLEYVKKK